MSVRNPTVAGRELDGRLECDEAEERLDQHQDSPEGGRRRSGDKQRHGWIFVSWRHALATRRKLQLEHDKDLPMFAR